MKMNVGKSGEIDFELMSPEQLAKYNKTKKKVNTVEEDHLEHCSGCQVCSEDLGSVIPNVYDEPNI